MEKYGCVGICRTIVANWSVHSASLCLKFHLNTILTSLPLLQAIKAVKRNNPRAEKMNMLRRRNLPASSHTPLTEKLGSLEHKIRKEIAIMKKCRHGHVVRLLEVIDDKLNDRIYMGEPFCYFLWSQTTVLSVYFDYGPWVSVSTEEL